MPLPLVKKSKHASSSGKSTSNKRKRSPSPQRHPYELKLDIRMEKIEDELHSIFDIADCNMIISNSQTGFSDFSMNETFADKLDATSVMLKGCAKRVSEKATEIRDKVQSCKDHKASIQPIQFVEEITDYSKKCPKAQDLRPKRVKKSKDFRIKVEYLDEFDNPAENDEGFEGLGGEPDGHFQYTKTNEYDSEAHSFVCKHCKSVHRSRVELRNHESNHTMEFYRCMICYKLYRSMRSFENHQLSHSSAHTCLICKQVFNLKSSLTNHLQTHNTTRMGCTYKGCKKEYKFRQNQLEHIKWAHRKTRDVPCGHCDKFFQTPTNMRSHRYRIHGPVKEITPGHPDMEKLNSKIT